MFWLSARVFVSDVLKVRVLSLEDLDGLREVMRLDGHTEPWATVRELVYYGVVSHGVTVQFVGGNYQGKIWAQNVASSSRPRPSSPLRS
jgi:hypothetical protein